MYQFEMSAYTRRTEGERTRHRRVRTHGAGKRNRVFTRLSKHQACIKHSLYEATIKQTSSKRRANAEQTSSWLKQAYWNPAPGSNVGLGLGSQPTADHVLYRPSNYNLPALLISMLITIERRTSCSMFARSCKHPIRKRLKFKVSYSSLCIETLVELGYLKLLSIWNAFQNILECSTITFYLLLKSKTAQPSITQYGPFGPWCLKATEGPSYIYLQFWLYFNYFCTATFLFKQQRQTRAAELQPHQPHGWSAPANIFQKKIELLYAELAQVLV